jgi:zinc D-Ala-D-Ala carboxypeptidase
MKLTANISLDELIKSQIAERKGINNNPSPMQIENLKALAVNILQPIRSHFDRPLIISSGFRTAELCIEIGSKITSEHCADNKSNQLILEFYKEGEPSSGWVHCSYSSDLNKKELLIAYREDGKVKYKPWR